MGCDGGSIVGRQELVAVKKRVTHAHSTKEVAKERANSCAISHEPLRHPVVVCAMGQLFNKDALIQYLLAKQKFPHFSHINNLKDVMQVKLHWNQSTAAAVSTSSSTNEERKEESIDSSDDVLYTCPVTGLPSNGVNRFVAMRPCGCVVSERALKSIGKLSECMVCNTALVADDTTSISTSSTTTTVTSTTSTAEVDSINPTSGTALPATSTSSSFHHPSYFTLFPGPEETLFLRGVIAERLKIKEIEKAKAKAAKKAAAGVNGATTTSNSTSENIVLPLASSTSTSTAMTDVTTTAPIESHKRKAEDQDVTSSSSYSSSSSSTTTTHAHKKHITQPGAHAALVAQRTGNILADSVKSITAAAAAALAERKKDANFSKMFLTKEQIANFKYDSISSKPASCMSML